MPPRRKPTSTRQKKADQQLKRAIKRGDIAPEDVPKKKTTHHKKRIRIGPTGQRVGATDTIDSARKLQSAFIKLSSDFLQNTRQLASDLLLSRPIPDERVIYRSFDLQGEQNEPLTCPRRPKWRFDMTKLEVERNEEGLFKKYLAQTDTLLEQWKDRGNNELNPLVMPRSPSHYERNLEVWRQLWRVTEISQIILVLLDSRCPVLHYPPSLSNYLGDRKIILVLTKVDIAGSTRVQAWIKYLNTRLPNSRIVQAESYIEKETEEHQGRKQFEPSIPDHFRTTLIEAIKEAHGELLIPPDKILSHHDRLRNWISPVKREVDWESVTNAKGGKVGLSVGGATIPRPKSPEGQDGPSTEDEQHEPTHLTIGLIGQPNVGKSSLLNALFGTSKVRASRTPGKTKHFQTLYWTPDVRLVDCPGLVMPNYVPMEMQVLSGILPISRVSAVPLCIHFASELLPLERIFNLVHPDTLSPPVEDKRTWREDRKLDDTNKAHNTPKWTAMDILTAYANAKGWVTAKAGRPDIHRAGNAILRALAEGRIGWAFWPPNTPIEEIRAAGGENQGIWIPRADSIEEREDDHPSDDEGDEVNDINTSSGSEYELLGNAEDEAENTEESESHERGVGLGRFGALAINEDEDTDES